MPIETIVPRRLYRQVADQLRQLFDSGEFVVGDRLPPERELAERMGISRPTIREALIALEVEGRVRIRVGSGIYVVEPPPVPPAPTSGEGPFELLRAREFLESAIAEEAARLAKPADVAALDEILEKMASKANPDHVTIALDRAFHIAIATIPGNAVLVRVVGELFDQRLTPFFERLSSYFEDPTTWQAAVEEHRHIRDAIAAGDTVRAKAAMQNHLGRSQERFSKSFSKSKPRTPPEGALSRQTV